MKFKNSDIYNLAVKIQKYEQNESIKLPMPLGFYLYKNLKIIKEAASEIEEMRQEIIDQYPIDEDTGKREISEEERNKAQKEMDRLSNLKQDLELYPLKLSDFQSLSLDNKLLEILIDMIQDDLRDKGEEE